MIKPNVFNLFEINQIFKLWRIFIDIDRRSRIDWDENSRRGLNIELFISSKNYYLKHLVQTICFNIPNLLDNLCSYLYAWTSGFISLLSHLRYFTDLTFE